MTSPLMTEMEAASFLGTDAKGLRFWRTQGRLHWYQRTRTFARKEVEQLALELAQEILKNASPVGRIESAVGSQSGFRKSASLAP